MAKVYEFPTKKELPEVVKDVLYDIAKAYVDVLDYTLTMVSSDEPTFEELEELKDLVTQELVTALDVALFESTFK